MCFHYEPVLNKVKLQDHFGVDLEENYHRPEDEKRMVVIMSDDEYDAWLSASPEESHQFLRQYPAEQMAVEFKV